MSSRMPVLFVGHGSPMNAIEDNSFTRGWRDVAAKIPVPKGIVCISAHWLQEGTGVTSMAKPKTIHDFYGFPAELYEIEYPAKGSPALAKRIQSVVHSAPVTLDTEWGLDHGTWSVLLHMFPRPPVPVVQVSLDYQLSPRAMYELGTELRVLREEGILLLGSGNLVHNLMRFSMDVDAFSWAKEFDSQMKRDLSRRKDENVVNFTQYDSAKLAHPTPDHFFPLLYVLGAASPEEKPFFFNETVTMGSISMTSVAFGLRA